MDDIVDDTVTSEPLGETAVLYGNPDMEIGVRNIAICLNGIDQNINLGTSVSCLSYPGFCDEGFTWAAWIKLGNIITKYPCYLMSSGGYKTTDMGFALFLNNSALGGRVATSDHIWSFEDIPVESGVWFHVAVTWDGADTGNMTIYINGDYNMAVSGELGDVGDNLHEDFIIGQNNSGIDFCIDEMYFLDIKVSSDFIKVNLFGELIFLNISYFVNS